MHQLAAQHRATAWAERFNQACQRAGLPNRIEYSEVRVASLPDRGPGVHVLVEPFMEGSFVKYNDNIGAVLGNDEAQAFSHYTYEASRHTEMMIDLQGIEGGPYSDALLHTECGEAFGGGRHGNRGKRGFSDFLDTHRCNGICQQLGLPRVEGCYAQPQQGDKRGRSRKGSGGKKRTKCKQCKSATNWDMEHQACWECDNDYFSEWGHGE